MGKQLSQGHLQIRLAQFGPEVLTMAVTFIHVFVGIMIFI